MEQTLLIRTATRDDLSVVDLLLSRSYPRLLAADYPPSVMVTAVPLIARARPELVALGRYYLVEDTGGRLLGAGGWSLSGKVAEVRHLATDPDALRRGVARAILWRVFARAAAAGVTGFECLSTRTAVPFYASVGFAVVGPVTVPLRAGIVFPAVRMVRAA